MEDTRLIYRCFIRKVCTSVHDISVDTFGIALFSIIFHTKLPVFLPLTNFLQLPMPNGMKLSAFRNCRFFAPYHWTFLWLRQVGGLSHKTYLMQTSIEALFLGMANLQKGTYFFQQ